MILQPDIPVILASASPRRRELLQELGLKFSVIPAHIHEAYLSGESVIEHVCRLAREKGEYIAGKHPDAVIVSADTIVVYKEHILGKPKNDDDAYRMLKMLSGQCHEVISAFFLESEVKGIRDLQYERTRVCFRKLQDTEIRDYIQSGSPHDKAGAYGIQDIHANLVNRIEGCYYNVIGFPLARFAEVWNRYFRLIK